MVGKNWMLLRDLEENILNPNQKLSVRHRVYFLLVCRVHLPVVAIYQPKLLHYLIFLILRIFTIWIIAMMFSYYFEFNNNY